MQYISFGQTDVGLRRKHNEDAFVCAENLGLFMVADGMGGHAAGEVASNQAIQTISEFIREARRGDGCLVWPIETDETLSLDQNLILAGIHQANRHLCTMSAQNPALSGMGTTIAGFFTEGDVAHVVHVGDSRVYLLRNGLFEMLTSDHSWVNEQLQRNMITIDEARTHRWRNVITRALGHKPTLEIDMSTQVVLPGDLFLLCSDGLTSMLEDTVIREALNGGGQDLAQTCGRLIDLANEAGGSDNITTILVRVEE
jgi:serine/threonine protein phosphatase PrpC